MILTFIHTCNVTIWIWCLSDSNLSLMNFQSIHPICIKIRTYCFNICAYRLNICTNLIRIDHKLIRRTEIQSWLQKKSDQIAPHLYFYFIFISFPACITVWYWKSFSTGCDSEAIEERGGPQFCIWKRDWRLGISGWLLNSLNYLSIFAMNNLFVFKCFVFVCGCIVNIWGLY